MSKLKNTLKESLDNVHMPDEVYNKTLTAMGLQKRNISRGGFTRFIAITAAAAVFLFGAVLVWKFFIKTDDTGPLESAFPSEIPSPSPSQSTVPSLSPSPPPSPSPLPSPSPSPEEIDDPGPPLINTNLFINIDWPEYPAIYHPNVSVFPLTNSGAIYTVCVNGAVTFVNEKLEPVILPFEPYHYITINDTWNGKPKAYAFKIDDGDYVLMLVDGTLPVNADGDYYRLRDEGLGDSVYIYNIGETVVYIRPDGLYGLYDLEERRELGAYNQIFMQYNVYIASNSNGQEIRHVMLDHKGRIIYDFGIEKYDDFFVDPSGEILYRYSDFDDPRFGSIYKRGTYYYIYERDEMGYHAGIIITDKDGRELYSIKAGKTWYMDDVIIMSDEISGLYVFDKSGAMKQFPLPVYPEHIQQCVYNGKEVIYAMSGTEWENGWEYYAVDEAGNVREALYTELENGPVRYKYPGIYGLVDSDGNILLETNGYLNIRGDFVIRLDRETLNDMRSDPRAVYNTDGALLLDNISGYIWEAIGPGGGLFVYLDKQTCVLLYPDGHTVPVQSAPEVEIIYYGG